MLPNSGGSEPGSAAPRAAAASPRIAEAQCPPGKVSARKAGRLTLARRNPGVAVAAAHGPLRMRADVAIITPFFAKEGG